MKIIENRSPYEILSQYEEWDVNNIESFLYDALVSRNWIKKFTTTITEYFQDVGFEVMPKKGRRQNPRIYLL